MTSYNRTTLKTFFETGDVPGGADYANLIDSCVNMSETGVQSMAGPLNPTELITPRVSATNVNVTGAFAVAQDVSANNGIIYASANRWSGGVVTVSGTTQATAAQLIYTINTLTGGSDGSQTGVILAANQTNRVQYVYNGAVSANLWPCVGGQINALSSNAAFGMAANTVYTVLHISASGYAVK